MTNPKGDLIEYCRVNSLEAPSFETHASGPEHQPVFACEAIIGGTVWGSASAKTKRDAEKQAAAHALENLRHGQPGAVVGEDDSDLPNDFDDDEEGPWPIFPEVLAQSLAVANSRVEAGKTGEAAVLEVQALALELYKGLIEDLGEYT